MRSDLHRVILGLLWPLAAPLAGPALSVGAEAGDSEMRGAYITSKHPVYTLGEPIDVTYWLRGGAETLTARFAIHDASGTPVPPNRADVAVPADGIAPEENHLGTVENLGRWYALCEPGSYAIVLTGESKGPGGARKAVRSNRLAIRVRQRPDPSDRVIGLEDIWALHMPGTRPMNVTMRGDPLAYEAPEGAMVDEIRRALEYDPSGHVAARRAFIVPGTGIDALRAAHAVLAKGETIRPRLGAGDPGTIVFFSRSFNYYVHIVSAEQRGDVIQVTYRFVGHRTKEMTAHLALVPIRGTGAQEVHVDVKPRMDAGTVALDWATWAERIVCRSSVLNVNGGS